MSLYEPLFRLAEAQVIGFDQLGIVKPRQGQPAGGGLAAQHLRDPRRTLGRHLGELAEDLRAAGRSDGRAGLATDQRFTDNVTRCAHADELDDLIADWFGERDPAR